jgi:hypothetical protein
MRARMKRMAALVVGCVMALTTSLVAATPASAYVFELQGQVCGGSTAPRCAWMNLDSTNNRLRGYGSISDATPARVFVQLRVMVEDRSPTRDSWRVLYITNIQGDWESFTLATGTIPCSNARIYRVTVDWNWNGIADRFTSREVRPNIC